jgi:hypothetical protein
MADDLSWIDHPANLRANAVLLRAVAEQSLLHADEIERLRNMLDNVMSVRRPRGGTMTDIVERLRKNVGIELSREAADEIERLTAECEAWRECAQYDPEMTGPAFKGWDRSALDRCRTRYIEMKS